MKAHDGAAMRRMGETLQCLGQLLRNRELFHLMDVAAEIRRRRADPSAPVVYQRMGDIDTDEQWAKPQCERAFEGIIAIDGALRDVWRDGLTLPATALIRKALSHAKRALVDVRLSVDKARGYFDDGEYGCVEEVCADIARGYNKYAEEFLDLGAELETESHVGNSAESGTTNEFAPTPVEIARSLSGDQQAVLLTMQRSPGLSAEGIEADLTERAVPVSLAKIKSHGAAFVTFRLANSSRKEGYTLSPFGQQVAKCCAKSDSIGS